jgi:alpha-tubulin suppressor-like RCC1 family protein
MEFASLFFSSCVPELVVLPPEIVLDGLKIRAGPDNSALITTAGTLYAWGSNAHNKLALDRKGICGFMVMNAVFIITNNIVEYFIAFK